MGLDHLPKSVVKALRYIKQDASLEMLRDIEVAMEYCIQLRKSRLYKERRSGDGRDQAERRETTGTTYR